MTATLASQYELVIVDLDGVVYLGAEAVDGAPAAIQAVLDAGTPVLYATNNASRSAADVAALLRSIGVAARADEILTSAAATAQVLARDLPPAAIVLVVGAPALADELRAVGLTPVTDADQRPVAVVQGYGRDVGWAALAEATVAIRAGARWVATNVDATLPSARGPLPGNGSLVAAVRTALGGRAPDLVVGKPEPTMVEVAARGPDGQRHALVVGDRLDTDMECAVRAGMDGLLVLTGVTTPADVLRAAAHERPTHVGADLAALSTPDAEVRVPGWRGSATTGGWRVTEASGRLALERSDGREANPGADGDGADPVAALRALAAAAWANPEWTGIDAPEPAAARALTALGLHQFAGWSVSAASSA